MENIKVGDIVIFHTPLTESEKTQRYKVLEVRGDKILVEEITLFNNALIKPTFLYSITDFKKNINK